MSLPESNEGGACSECGATLPANVQHCWLCKGEDRPVAGAAAGPPAHFERRAAFQFSLATLMLLVTLCAVVLGVFRMFPGLGIMLAVLSTPAWVRTSTAARRRRARGQPMTLLEKLGAFAGFLGVAVIILVASGAAFLTTCFAGMFGMFLGPVGILIFVGSVPLAIVAALYVARRLKQHLWHRED